MLKFFLSMFFIVLALAYCCGQNKPTPKIMNSKSSFFKESIKIDSSRPAVYIDFLNIGQGEPLNSSELKERVYLKLVNNSKWSIFVPLFVYGKNDENTGLFYDVELERVRKLKDSYYEDVEVPQGYEQGDCCTGESELKSGKSVRFSVPVSHLSKNLKIRVDFNFAWEIDSKGNDIVNQSIYPEIKFSAFFTNSMLERFIKKKQ